jgi:hypothetical protein
MTTSNRFLFPFLSIKPLVWGYTCPQRKKTINSHAKPRRSLNIKKIFKKRIVIGFERGLRNTGGDAPFFCKAGGQDSSVFTITLNLLLFL